MLKQTRVVFYTVFGVLHLFIFLFSLYMDGQSNNIQFLLQLQGKIWMLKYGSFLLLILFGTNVILHIRDNRRHKKDHADLVQELNVVKAKMYDYQEAGKAKQTAP